MTVADNRSFRAILDRIEQQWTDSAVAGLSTVEVDNSLLLSGSHTLSNNHQAMTYTALISAGMIEHSCNLIFLASLPVKQQPSDDLYAFLLQLSSLMAPLEFILDLESEQLVIRQSQLISQAYPVEAKSFASSVNWLTPYLLKATEQIKTQTLSLPDARLMADFLSENYFEAIAE